MHGSPWLITVALCTAAIGTAIAARRDRCPDPLRRPFAWIGWAVILHGLVDAIRVMAHEWLDATIAVQLAVAMQLAATAAAVVGLATAPRAPSARGSLPRRVVDAVIVLAVASYLGWILVIDRLQAMDGAGPVAVAGTLAGSILIGHAVVAFHRVDPSVAAPVRLAAFGVALVGAEAHTTAWWSTIRGGGTIHTLDGMVLLGGLLVLGAQRWSRRYRPEPNATPSDLGLLTGPLTVALAIATGALRHASDTSGGVAFWGLIAVVTLSLVRQALTLREVRSLTDSLRTTVDALQHRAEHDELTGLVSRRVAMARLDELLAEVAPDREVALLFLDVDRFKTVNDSLGHDRGDTLLTEVGSRLRRAVGTDATVARFGGDEFIVITTVGEERELDRLIERVRDRVAAPMSLGGIEVVVTTSMGVARVSAADAANIQPDELLRNADLALYQAKRGGRDRAEHFTDDLRQAAGERLALASDLRRARARDEIEVFYQPVVALPSGQIVGAEALVRWNDPRHGILYPDEWLPVAEETGIITEIGRTTLETSCRRFAALNRIRPGEPLRVAVNLSAAEVRSTGLVDTVERILRESRLPPSLLLIEVSEQIAGDQRTVETLHELRSLGVRLSIDDFGTGYSALGQLRRFPVDEIKIDQSFVAGLGVDAADTSIVRAVTDLGIGLSLDVVAEGVTTEAQAAALASLGCPFAQGWLYGKAQPFHRFVQLLERMDAERERAAEASDELEAESGSHDRA